MAPAACNSLDGTGFNNHVSRADTAPGYTMTTTVV